MLPGVKVVTNTRQLQTKSIPFSFWNFCQNVFHITLNDACTQRNFVTMQVQLACVVVLCCTAQNSKAALDHMDVGHVAIKSNSDSRQAQLYVQQASKMYKHKHQEQHH